MRGLLFILGGALVAKYVVLPVAIKYSLRKEDPDKAYLLGLHMNKERSTGSMVAGAAAGAAANLLLSGLAKR